VAGGAVRDSTRVSGSRRQRILLEPDDQAFEPIGGATELARFLTNERRCCPFLSFDIAIASNGGPVWLHITGPEGTREFLAAELPGFGSN
jgi:hypothetical protein